MAREARIDVADQWYHIIARGQRRDTLFFDAKDRKTYLETLSLTLKRNQADLGAYCFMTNHIHLLVYRRVRSLGTVFRQTHMSYATYFNARHKKTGYVFQGRFKSFLVLDEKYLSALVRYIHMNPVKAKMVGRADDYRWSSDCFYRGGAGRDAGLIVRVPGFEGRGGARAYREIMEDEIADVPRNHQFVGEEGDEKKIERRKVGRDRWSREDRRSRVAIRERIMALLSNRGLTLEDVKSRTKRRVISGVRQRIMSELYAEGYPPGEIALNLGRTVPAVILAHARHHRLGKC